MDFSPVNIKYIEKWEVKALFTPMLSAVCPCMGFSSHVGLLAAGNPPKQTPPYWADTQINVGGKLN